MKRILCLLATTAAIALTSTAVHAADMAVKAYAAPLPPPPSWTGFYLGLNGGFGGDRNQYPFTVGGVAGTFSLIFQAIAVLVFPISYAIFSFFYSMYGAVLYVVGPLVLALYPALGVGQLARTFMVNLLVWNAWGIIYAIISQLLTIMSANSLTSIFTSQSFGGAFQGASQMLLISLSSILLSIMILLIPFIAKRVVSGDVGSTMLTVAGVAAAALQAAVAGWAGMQGGAASAAGGGDPPPPPGGPGGGGGDASGGSNRSPSPPPDGSTAMVAGEAEASGHAPPAPGGAAMMDTNSANGGGGAVANAENRPPNDSSSAPRQSQGRPGHFGHYNIPHAVGWSVGTWAGATRRTVSSAFHVKPEQPTGGGLSHEIKTGRRTA